MEEKEQKNFVIRCGGGVKAYLTKIVKKKGENPVYVYGTKEKNKAKRFTQEEATAIAEKHQAVVIKINK